MENQPIFALDIGTRSVVGLLLQKQKNLYKIVDIEVIEHHERSMLDGQIHNVLSVSEVITEIKTRLELKNGPLTKVCVAAAGRSLKTKRSKVEIEIPSVLDHEDILHLELSAVQQAQFLLAQEGEKSFHYYCVGYSVVEYKLDEERIGSLIDQTGNKAAVEVIATFLPKVVVESLIAALSRSGLELEALTLEPIAAINVLIPASMRRLNVALVDIGAGTSDIAITNDGTVVAYGMVPIAGDEITEAISEQFLLDFPVAEMIKRQLSVQDEVVLTDILGFQTTYQRNEILDPIMSAIKQLAHAITEQILLLNQTSPKAVMLIGGGSMTPMLSELVASLLELPANRVAIRGIDAISLIEQPEDSLAGPELVTPIGIAIAAKESPIEYISITVNEKPIRLFDVKKLTIGDGLLAAGVEVSKLYGKPGMALMVTINNRIITIPGKHGSPPVLLKNGEVTSLDSPLSKNDHITVKKGEDGHAAAATVKDVIENIPSISVTLNDRLETLVSTIVRNGEPVELDEMLRERDSIVVTSPMTVKDCLLGLKLDNLITDTEEFYIFLGENKVALPSKKKIVKNGTTATLDSAIKDGDRIDIQEQRSHEPTLLDLTKKTKLQVYQTITVIFNGKPVTLKKQKLQFIREAQVLAEEDSLHNRDRLSIKVEKNEAFILQDLFKEMELETNIGPNQKLVIQKNGINTTFSSQIITGDKITVKWEALEIR